MQNRNVANGKVAIVQQKKMYSLRTANWHVRPRTSLNFLLTSVSLIIKKILINPVIGISKHLNKSLNLFNFT